MWDPAQYWIATQQGTVSSPEEIPILQSPFIIKTAVTQNKKSVNNRKIVVTRQTIPERCLG
jgi:hypothetical protein